MTWFSCFAVADLTGGSGGSARPASTIDSHAPVAATLRATAAMARFRRLRTDRRVSWGVICDPVMT